MSYKISLKVRGKRTVRGTVNSDPFSFEMDIDVECPSKKVLFLACIREFGRCLGNLNDINGSQMGWKFEGREKGTEDWWYTEVQIVSGAVNVGLLRFIDKE